MKKVSPEIQPNRAALDGDFLRMAQKRGIKPTHARVSRLKLGKIRMRRIPDAMERTISFGFISLSDHPPIFTMGR